MRNGNEYSQPFMDDINESSQPNYEEWKLIFGSGINKGATCSQPNYEEWKLIKLFFSFFHFNRSQPNYEEWKPIYICGLHLTAILFPA